MNYSKLCMFTDENINSMIDKLDLDNKDILTVTLSGDQALNFLLDGAHSVKLFDSNPYSEAYFYLKKALIQNLSYDEFLNFFLPSLFNKKDYFSVEKYELAKKDLPFGKIRSFWNNVFMNFSKHEIKDLFLERNYNRKDIIKRNNYLKNEENYNKLREILKGIDKVDFNNLDVTKQILYVDKKVDFIYLSELLNGVKAESQVEYLKKIKALTLNISYNIREDGIIAVNYMHCYLDDYWYNFKNKIQTLIAGPDDSNNFLKHDCATIDFKGGYIPDSPVIKDRDAVILYKKKIKKRTRSN